MLDTVIDAALWQIDTTGAGTVYHFAIGQGADQELKGWMHLRADNGKGFAHIMDKTQGHPQEYRLDERERSLNAYYYHLDHLGTPQVITDQAQNIVWHASYAPFGQTVVTSETIDNDLRFPGQYYDQESGLYYNWNRYYDPATGRYITSDPIGLEGGLNTYAYVENNPVNLIDPEGLASSGQTTNLGGGTTVRIDNPHVPGQQEHTHVQTPKGEAVVNQDGSQSHKGKGSLDNLNKKAKDFLRGKGFKIPGFPLLIDPCLIDPGAPFCSPQYPNCPDS